MNTPSAVQSHLHAIHLSGGKLEPGGRAALSALAEAFAGAPSRDTLVLHFHGGLNTRADGLVRVDDLAPVYREAGAYPVFFCWQSGLGEVLTSALRQIVDEPFCRRIVERIARFILGKARGPAFRATGVAGDDATFEADLARLLAGATLGIDDAGRAQSFRMHDAEARALRTELVNDPAFSGAVAAIAAGARADPGAEGGRPTRGREPGTAVEPRPTRLRPDVLNAIAGSGPASRSASALIAAAAVVDVARGVCRRMAQGRDHGVLATIIEEILIRLYFVEGWFSWMKDEIGAAFGPDPDCGATAFLDMLRARADAGHRPRIILVGHSAGSIYVCHFLEQARRVLPQARFDVVLLTPAVSFRRFSRMLDTCEETIAGFRHFSLSDTLEQRDGYPAYPRSLLYFTSGVMEYDPTDRGDVPILGMQRFDTDSGPLATADVARARRFFARHPHATVWVDESPAVQQIATSRGHGDFDADPAMRRTLAHLIRHGF